MDGHSVSLREESGLAQVQRLVKIGVLPDDVLVEIFNFYVKIRTFRYWKFPLRNTWHTLVHVCCRWRYLVFSSPHYLNLQLEYEGHRPMSEVPGVWPVLPVILGPRPSEFNNPESDQQLDNMVAALESEHYDRIRQIYINNMTQSLWERFAAAMQKPFPELTHLEVWGNGVLVPVLPGSFLGGSAPRLRELILARIPFPSIPKLLLSANGLVKLSLLDIPDSGCFSPEAMSTALSMMTRLESLDLQFHSPRSRPDPASRSLLPPTRFVLPALTELMFKGVYEYLEDLLARIDTPLLYDLQITFFTDLNFDLPRLHRLIGHAEEFKSFDHARVLISSHSIQLLLSRKTPVLNHLGLLSLRINCKALEWQLSSLAQVCGSSFPLISALEELEIHGDHPSSDWKHDMENAQWLELLDPFTALKHLSLRDRIPLHVCSALAELSGERVTEVLPSLENIYISFAYLPDGSRKAIATFVSARRRSGHPVRVYRESGSRSRSWIDIKEDLESGD